MKKLALLLVVLLLAAGAWTWWHAVPGAVQHTVVRGDTLGKIAQVHGVSVAELRGWNGIRGDLIEVGQVLEIRVGAPIAAAPRKPTHPRRTAPPPTAAPAPLRMPKAKPCLSGPSLDGDGGEEPSFAASAGLSRGQIRGALDGFLPTLGLCFGDDWPTGRVEFDLRVACTGRVAHVATLDEGGLDPATVACMADTLRFASFPAHDLPDGMDFRYPVTLSAE
jgi:hypothetical protein